MQSQIAEARKIPENPDPKKFDLRVNHWDRNGNQIAHNPYRMHTIGEVQYFERPVNSGNLWTEGNEPAGRLKITGTGKSRVKSVEDVPHVEFKAPITADQKLANENAELKARVAALELKQIEDEKAKRDTKAPNIEKLAQSVEPTQKVPPTLSKRGES